MTEEQIIEEARQAFYSDPVNDGHCNTLLDALETFYMNGFPDEVSGDVESITGHFYRVDRWLVITDSQGFRDVWEHASEEEAKQAFEELDADYAVWEGDDDYS